MVYLITGSILVLSAFVIYTYIQERYIHKNKLPFDDKLNLQ